MIGAIIGDIAGSIFEIRESKNTFLEKRVTPREEKLKVMDIDYPLFTNECIYTDDTVLTIAIADAILSEKPYEDKLQEYGKKEVALGKDVFGRDRFGSGFMRWLEGKSDCKSRGNGAGMRVSAIGEYFDSLDKVMYEAELATIPTHNTKESIECAQAVAGSVFLARTGYTKKDIKDFAQQVMGRSLDFDYDDLIDNYTFKMKGVNSIPQAIYIFLISDNFEDALRKSLSIGGDSDTIASITCAIAESFYGMPENLRNHALNYLPKEYVEVLNNFENKQEINQARDM